jgi:hypothetical protein
VQEDEGPAGSAVVDRDHLEPDTLVVRERHGSRFTGR